jgi:hypothetical protein
MTLEELIAAFTTFKDEVTKKVDNAISQIDKLATKDSVTQLGEASTKDTQTLRESLAGVVSDINIMKGELTSLGAKVMEKTPAPPKATSFKLPSLFD